MILELNDKIEQLEQLNGESQDTIEKLQKELDEVAAKMKRLLDYVISNHPGTRNTIVTAGRALFGDAVSAAVFNAIPEGGIDAEPEDAEDADVEVVGVSKKKQVKVKVEPEEVIEPEPESDVDSVDDDTEETQVLDAALKTLPKIK